MPPKSSSGFSLLRWGRGLLLLALVAIIVYSTGKYGTGHSSSGSGMSGPSRLARAVLAGGSGGAAGGQFDYAAWRAARDADTIHILITACLTHKGVQVESFNLIKSILRAREGGASHNRKYHFHVTIDGVFRRLLDDEEEQRKSYPAFADTLLFIRNYTRGLVALSFYPVSTQDKDIAVYMGDEGQSLPQNSYKECATQRLKTPFISALTNLSRMLYIDADAVVSCDLEQLWDVEFARWKPGAIFAAALEQAHSNYPTPYWSVRSDPKMRKPSFYEGGMNAGVLLIDADKLRAVGKELWNYIRNLTAHKNYEAYGFDSKFAEQVRSWVVRRTHVSSWSDRTSFIIFLCRVRVYLSFMHVEYRASHYSYLHGYIPASAVSLCVLPPCLSSHFWSR